MATIADELNAISVEHGYTGAAPKTIAGAIDALADTLAGTDVEERRTIAGAIHALAPYIGTGGGGGTELGPLVDVPAISESVPVVDGPVTLETAVAFVSIGDQPVAVTNIKVATGTTVNVDVTPASDTPLYAVRTSAETSKYTAVRQLDIPYTSDSNGIVFAIPTLESDEVLVVVASYSIGG